MLTQSTIQSHRKFPGLHSVFSTYKFLSLQATTTVVAEAIS